MDGTPPAAKSTRPQISILSAKFQRLIGTNLSEVNPEAQTFIAPFDIERESSKLFELVEICNTAFVTTYEVITLLQAIKHFPSI